ncbi:MAG: pseudaminic acid cytidylyltransferase [Neisseriaceae bacterium]|nr:pseudaminic acid cytidylyltransferase [Neisseriaceae bacterium]
MTLCIIPARGGSKRIPRKNIKLFHGKPMIAYSIQAALKSACFEHIIVSTDDKEIAQVAREHGATTPFMRPENLADDFATTGDVMRHAISEMQKQGWQGEQVCCLYATAPFVQEEKLQEGLAGLQKHHADFALAVTAYSSPIQRSWSINHRGQLIMNNPEMFAMRSQDLSENFYDVGQFCWGTYQAWTQPIDFKAAHIYPVIIPHYLAQDIDTAEDWVRAESMYRVLMDNKD